MALFEGTPLPKIRTKKGPPKPKLTALERIREKSGRTSGRTTRRQDAAAAKEARRPHFYDNHCEPASEEETTFRHRFWGEKRKAVREALQSTGAREAALWAFDHCGSGARIEHSPSTKKKRIRANYCHCRHCEPCMKSKANKMAANLRKRLAQRPNGKYRFVTLTSKHNRLPLDEQIRKLYKDFKKLRESKWWKSIVRGGAVTLEVKLDENDDYWHPHLHVIVEGDFIPQSQLSARWLQVTGESSVVDVRMLENSQSAAFYLTKYVTKSTSENVWHLKDRAQEWVVASKGVRTCFTIGSWRGFQLLQRTQDVTDWVPVCSLVKLVHDLRECQPYAIALWNELRPPAESPDEEPLDGS